MSIKMSDYTYSNAASTDYPNGSAKNASGPNMTDGTPCDAAWVNDLFGFQQAVLSAAGVVASGAPDTAQVSQLRDAIETLMWSPGDYKPAAYSTPGRRWLECAGGSIGSGASGATARANDDTLALFTKLWGEAAYVIQDNTGVASTRGASASADWSAGKRIVLPDTRGESFIGWDHGRGVDAGRTLGSWKAGQIQAHTHTVQVNGAAFPISPSGSITSMAVSGAGNTGSTGGTENMVRGIAVMWMIRY